MGKVEDLRGQVWFSLPMQDQVLQRFHSADFLCLCNVKISSSIIISVSISSISKIISKSIIIISSIIGIIIIKKVLGCQQYFHRISN